MVYLRVANNSKYSFLLESIVGGESIARYSFIGAGRRSLSSIKALHSRPLSI